LNEFPVSKKQNLTGNYQVDNSTHDFANCVIVNTDTGEMTEANFFKLVQHLDQNRRGDALNENDVIAINHIHKDYINEVTNDWEPRKNLPEGRYLIKGFRNSGNSMELVSQNGTVYRVQSSQLGKFTIDHLED